ncbi:MAG: hypothetical protein WCH43_07810 [Verrucomicrobiota bacterium]
MDELAQHQGFSGDGAEILPASSGSCSLPAISEPAHCSLAGARKPVSKKLDPPSRFFKRTGDGQWQAKSTDGKYNKLSASRLIKRLQTAILKHGRRAAAE